MLAIPFRTILRQLLMETFGDAELRGLKSIQSYLWDTQSRADYLEPALFSITVSSIKMVNTIICETSFAYDWTIKILLYRDCLRVDLYGGLLIY